MNHPADQRIPIKSVTSAIIRRTRQVIFLPERQVISLPEEKALKHYNRSPTLNIQRDYLTRIDIILLDP